MLFYSGTLIYAILTTAGAIPATFADFGPEKSKLKGVRESHRRLVTDDCQVAIVITDPNSLGFNDSNKLDKSLGTDPFCDNSGVCYVEFNTTYYYCKCGGNWTGSRCQDQIIFEEPPTRKPTLAPVRVSTTASPSIAKSSDRLPTSAPQLPPAPKVSLPTSSPTREKSGLVPTSPPQAPPTSNNSSSSQATPSSTSESTLAPAYIFAIIVAGLLVVFFLWFVISNHFASRSSKLK